MRNSAKSTSSKTGTKKRFNVEAPGIELNGIAKTDHVGNGDAASRIGILGNSGMGVSQEEKYQLIAEAAYFLSEKRSFAPGHELDDWLAAEAEIEARLSQISASRGNHCDGGTRTRSR